MTINQIIKNSCLPELMQSSRIHKVISYFEHDDVYMKRDDELGLGIGGSMARKFASIVFAIKKKAPDYVVIEGSLNSNNVLGITSLLNSYDVKVVLALPKSHSQNLGNALWIKQIANKSQLIEIESTRGASNNFYQEKLKTDSVFIIKEGACQVESLPGLFTLGKEIIDFENENGFEFENIYIDAGTGVTAFATYLSMAMANRKPHFYVTLIAGNETEFVKMARQLIGEFNKEIGIHVDFNLQQFTFLKPSTAKSFGSVNATIKQEWQTIMRELGFPIDLTYTAKHFNSVKNHLYKSSDLAKSLVLNCGSWLSARNHENLFQNNHQ
jgi:1-aminocyclopropane-1-carboxylate deaminase/D-cysteine desulfhydrase-like pyridoxal-dependent ACC family enzyme